MRRTLFSQSPLDAVFRVWYAITFASQYAKKRQEAAKGRSTSKPEPASGYLCRHARGRRYTPVCIFCYPSKPDKCRRRRPHTCLLRASPFQAMHKTSSRRTTRTNYSMYTIHEKIPLVNSSANHRTNQHNKSKQKGAQRNSAEKRPIPAAALLFPPGDHGSTAPLCNLYGLLHNVRFTHIPFIRKISAPAQDQICFFKIGTTCIRNMNDFFLTTLNHVRHTLSGEPLHAFFTDKYCPGCCRYSPQQENLSIALTCQITFIKKFKIFVIFSSIY